MMCLFPFSFPFVLLLCLCFAGYKRKITIFSSVVGFFLPIILMPKSRKKDGLGDCMDGVRVSSKKKTILKRNAEEAMGIQKDRVIHKTSLTIVSFQRQK